MGKALAAKNDNVRADPYPKKKLTKRDTSGADKENIDAKPIKQPKTSRAAAEIQKQYGDFLDIELEEVLGEVPCYDDASTVRRKLNKLRTDKGNIPGTKKKWTQASMARLMQELEERDGAVEYKKNSVGPSARTLGTFLKKSGKMGGGDSPSYYWGYVLCEKLRMWEGGKKTKTREEKEME
ncbi:MAG: hypothetical protein Q9167_000587 [Letrouitia subvulpina]